MSPQVKNAKDMINKEMNRELEELKKKLDGVIGDNTPAKTKYKKRLKHIFDLIRDKLAIEGMDKKVFRTSDFYQRIESFMLYDTMQDDIYTLIGEVFKSMYINFILMYLDEEEESFFIPYLGNLSIHKYKRDPNNGHGDQQTIASFAMDKGLRMDLRRIERDEQISIIEDLLNKASRSSQEILHIESDEDR